MVTKLHLIYNLAIQLNHQITIKNYVNIKQQRI
jgi:hypothetical protein